MIKNKLIAVLVISMFTLVFADTADDILGVWQADAEMGDLGAVEPYGSLTSAGWLSYQLTLNGDGSFAVVGMNVFDDEVYGDGDGVIHYSGTYTIDDMQLPMWIDLTVLASDNLFFPTDPLIQPLQNGIFELNPANDALTIQYGSELAWGIPRPTEFSAPSVLVTPVFIPEVPVELLGDWNADAFMGDLGELEPYGSLLSAGWLSYLLTLNDDWSFSVVGLNVFDDEVYGDGDGVIHYSGTFTVDMDQVPMWIDLTVTSSDNLFFPTDPLIQPLQNGIFELNPANDAMTIQYGSELAWGIPRPTEFSAPSVLALVVPEPEVPVDLTGIWYADAEVGDLGVLDPYGSLASAGWLSYMLTINEDWTFTVAGWNPFDDVVYGDGDGVIHYGGTFTVDAEQDPLWIDLTVLESDNLFFPTDPLIQPLQNGIYAINPEGDELTIQFGSELAWGIPRPAEFSTSSVLVLQPPCATDGDVSLDGNLDVLDVVAIVAHILNTEPLTLNKECHADINDDGSVDILDVVMVVDNILNPARAEADASQVLLNTLGNCVSMTGNGFVGGIQMQLEVGEHFSFEMNSQAWLADFNQQGSTVTMVFVHPGEELFTYSGSMEIVEVIAASSNGYIDVSLADEFLLLRNYPNPFNPVTQVEYSVVSSGPVKMAVYNISGQEITTLVNQIQDRGNYAVSWDGSEFSSGIYFLNLETAGVSESRKITLLK